MDKRHLDHSAKVLCGFLEPRKDAAAFFKPADELFNDRTPPVCVSVKSNLARVSVLVALRGNDGLYVQLEKVVIDPVRTIGFVTSHRNWPCDWITVKINDGFICTLKHGDNRRGLMSLAARQMKMKRVSLPIGEYVDFCRKTPAGAA